MVNLPDLPKNVHKCIAEFIPSVKYECSIRLLQFTGCPSHVLDGASAHNTSTCHYCKYVYTAKGSEVLVLLKKGGNKTLYHKYINIIRDKITHDATKLKADYSHFASSPQITKMEHLSYKKANDRFVGPEPLLHWETSEYDEKYIIKGVKWALFFYLKYEIHPIHHFSASTENKSIESFSGPNSRAPSRYYDVSGCAWMNPLKSVNKLYNRYCK